LTTKQKQAESTPVAYMPKPQASVVPPENIESEPAKTSAWQMGLVWALLSPVFLGTVPILAKLAYATGATVLTVVTFRTLFAAGIMWIATGLFARQYIRSSLPAIISSLVAGGINGIGSIFFYASLTRIDASVGQLINITYLIFVTIFLRLAGQSISWLTMLRTGITIFAIYLLTQGGLGPADWIGVGMMLVAAISYAIQLVFSQRILLDIPAQTMTLYAISAMAGVVSIAWVFQPTSLSTVNNAGWNAILMMGLATALARLTLFLGVKSLGSIQTALLGVFEVIVTIGIAAVLLHERLTLIQWTGAAILVIGILLVRYERNVPPFIDWWQIVWKWKLRK
jgi:drug/metabolite transporter (DMT)-like permease